MTQHEKIVEVLRKLGVKDCQINGVEIIYDEGVTQPTKAEIDAELARMESPEYEVEQWRETFKVPTYKLEIELEDRGLMTTVQTLINGASRSTQIGWEKSPTVRRISPTMLALSQHPSLALTAEQLDDIFKSADLREL